MGYLMDVDVEEEDIYNYKANGSYLLLRVCFIFHSLYSSYIT